MQTSQSDPGDPGETRKRRAGWVAIALVLVGALGVGVFVLVRTGDHDAAAREVARQHVELIATANAADLEALLALTRTDDPGAIRTAGELLVRADERIQEFEVGEVREVDEWRVLVPVSYELAGREFRGDVELVRARESSGGSAADWHVSKPLVGAIDWTGAGSDAQDVFAEASVASRRLVRPQQPLYPGVYAVQRRLPPYYETATVSTVVAAGEPVPAPTAPLEPTDRARDAARADLVAVIESCGKEDPTRSCPLWEVATDLGVRSLVGGDWFVGLVGEIKTEFNADAVEVSTVVELRTPEGVERAEVSGQTRFGLNFRYFEVRVHPFEMRSR